MTQANYFVQRKKRDILFLNEIISNSALTIASPVPVSRVFIENKGRKKGGGNNNTKLFYDYVRFLSWI